MGNATMLSGLLKGASWDEVTEYLSPAVLDIVAPGALSKELMALSGNFVRKRRWRARRDAVVDNLKPWFPGLEVAEDLRAADEDITELSVEERKGRAQSLLTLYFVQIDQLYEVLLDFRSSRIQGRSRVERWSPAPLWVQWKPGFSHPLRSLYRGFYGDDSRVFEGALRELSLTPAKDIFLGHFGDGDQTKVRFDLNHFRATFHETFLICKAEGVRLDSQFVTLGLMLACLYEHLQRLDVECDVRGAFHAAMRAAG